MQLNDSTEKRIIAAARKEFIDNGFKGARMQSIADQGQVNKALLHYYFRSKERLYEAVFQDIAITLRQALETKFDDLATGTDLPSFIRSIITAYMQTLQRNSDFPRFIIRELADGGKRLPSLIESVIPALRHIPPTIHQFLAKERLSGTASPIPPLHLMLNIVGMCVFTFVAQPVITEVNRQFHLDIEYDDAFFAARIDAICTMTLHGIVRTSQQEGRI